MKLINFVPQRIRERHARRRLTSILLVAALFGAGVMVALWLPLSVEVEGNKKRLEAELAASANQPAAQQGIITEDVAARIAQLNTFSLTEVSWPRAFALAGKIIPKDIRLNSYSYGTANNQITLRLSGEAPSNLSFATFLASLKSNKQISSYKVDGYAFTPGTNKVVFGVTLQVPLKEVDYSK